MIRPKSKHRGFSIFRSARDEADKKLEMQGGEGGHMSSTAGRIVGTPDSEMPYKVILTLESGDTTEHAVATMREAEAFIRRNTPRPAVRSTTYDHDPDSA